MGHNPSCWGCCGYDCSDCCTGTLPLRMRWTQLFGTYTLLSDLHTVDLTNPYGAYFSVVMRLRFPFNDPSTCNPWWEYLGPHPAWPGAYPVAICEDPGGFSIIDPRTVWFECKFRWEADCKTARFMWRSGDCSNLGLHITSQPPRVLRNCPLPSGCTSGTWNQVNTAECGFKGVPSVNLDDEITGYGSGGGCERQPPMVLPDWLTSRTDCTPSRVPHVYPPQVANSPANYPRCHGPVEYSINLHNLNSTCVTNIIHVEGYGQTRWSVERILDEGCDSLDEEFEDYCRKERRAGRCENNQVVPNP